MRERLLGAGILLVCLLLGAVLWNRVGHRLGPTYTGLVSGRAPIDPGLADCRTRLSECGQDLVRYARNHQGRYPDTLEEAGISQATCPLTGLPYLVRFPGDSSALPWLYCPGFAHGATPNAVWYDFLAVKPGSGTVQKRDDTPFGGLYEAESYRFADNSAEGWRRLESLATKTLPELPLARVRVACLLDLYRFDEARSSLDKALVGSPKDADLLALATRLECAQGHFSEARARAQAGWEATRQSTFQAWLARVAWLSADDSAALQSARELDPPGSAPVWVAFGSHRESEVGQLAAQYLAKAGYHRPDSVSVAVLAALAGQGTGGEAETLGKTCLARALVEADRVWPYPLLRWANLELTDEELLKLAGTDPLRLSQTHALLGLQAQLKGAGEDARSHFQWMRANGFPDCLETALTAAYVKGVP